MTIRREGGLKYERLTRTLRDEITSGRLKPGDMLPPEIDLAKQMGLARNTVRQALRELESRRMIRRVRGKGTIVCEAHDPATAIDIETSQLIGLALPELRAAMYQSLQAGLSDAMADSGASMVVCDSNQDLFRQVDLTLRLVHRGIGGLVMVPITTEVTPAHHISFLRDRGIPVVFCHRGVEGVKSPLIGFSPGEMGRVAGGELADHGHRRVAMVFSHRSPSCRPRMHGVREAMRAVGGAAPEEFVIFDRSTRADVLPEGIEERLTRALQRMMAHPDPPTGIVVSADSLAALTCTLLQRIGRRVPDDVSVIGFGDRTNRYGMLPLTLTSVTVDEFSLGEHAFRTLDEMRRGDRPIDDDETMLMPLQVTPGDTVGPAPNA